MSDKKGCWFYDKAIVFNPERNQSYVCKTAPIGSKHAVLNERQAVGFIVKTPGEKVRTLKLQGDGITTNINCQHNYNHVVTKTIRGRF